MGRSKDKNTWAGIIIGPVIIGGSVMALWQNEHRFNYHKAAEQTVAVAQVQSLQSEQVFSYTGDMDQSLTIQGQYVDSFTGYLTVKRRAEIYAWEEDEDDDGNTEWSKRWMSSVENNSRNSGIKQRLSSKRFIPQTFQAGELQMQTDRMEFVDPFQSIAPDRLALSDQGEQHDLAARDKYFYLEKGQAEDLGDERISYSALPVPATATYFGKFGRGQAVAHQAEKKEGFISGIIKDTGVLHHLVAGEREPALGTMKAHIKRLKMIVRGIGLLANIIGWSILFGFFTRFLIHIPVIGNLAQWGALLLALVFGLTVGGLTIITAFITSQPLALIGIAVAAIASIVMLRRKGRQSQQAVRTGLETQVGYALSPEQIKELEFIELTHLAGADGEVDANEKKYLREWGKRHGWDDAKVASLVERAMANPDAQRTESSSREHLLQLIRLALADGTLDGKEMKTIRTAAKDIGCKKGEVSRLIAQARTFRPAA